MDGFKEIDVFDRAYWERIRDAVWKAIVEMSQLTSSPASPS
jgi:hypothetical protein